MNRLMLASATALVLFLTGTSSAQSPYSSAPGYYNPYLNQPRISPYLNLVRGANSTGLNYYLGTLPEVERRAYQSISSAAIRRLERQQAGLEEDLEDLQTGTETPTGHPVQFANTYGYFPQAGPGGLRYGSQRLPGQQQRRR